MSDSYHHGDLRRALLHEAARAIAETGPSSVSLRDLARKTGVSHAAPAHHFGDHRGLMTALATEGLLLLAEELRAAASVGFDEAAMAYVRFAQTHPGHYAVMHRPDLINTVEPEFIAARAAAALRLTEGVRSIPVDRRRHVTVEQAAQTAWALVHGIASLAAEGALPAEQIEDLTRHAAHQLFG